MTLTEFEAIIAGSLAIAAALAFGGGAAAGGAQDLARGLCEVTLRVLGLH